MENSNPKEKKTALNPFLCGTKFTCTAYAYFFLFTLDVTEFDKEEPDAESVPTTTLDSIGWTESDSRPSAIATGAVVGLLCCVIPLVAMLILDLPALSRDLRRMVYNVTGKESRS